ncbi:MAG: diguanylate cyclase [Candidatus Eremiobacteraeota bacterium]|nr:diguanylate cyclase [Candidatus Eremiobacteraeota bacterium]
MESILHENGGGSHTEALRRAHLVRTVAQVLAAESALDELWARVCVPLGLLADARRVSVALREADAVPLVYASPPDEGVGGETLVVPIRFGAEVLGELVFEGVAADDPELITLLDSCALFVGARLAHERTVRSSAQLAELANTDALTGIANRRAFDEALAREWARAARGGTALSALIVDLDHFKLYNDGYGHQAGDLCLRQVAHAFGTCMKRPGDLLARYGGEEFVALLPATDLAGAIALGEALRRVLAELGIVHAGSSLGRVSASVGAASVLPGAGTRPETLLRAADEALYQAKRNGRDRVAARGYEGGGEAAQRLPAGPPTNLPLQLTRLVGRRTEVAAVRALLAAERLVSIIGLGGTGKTRLAVQVASEALDAFPDGVRFADLSPLADASLLAATVGAAFDARIPTDDATDELVRAIGERRALLVLDNCEHVIGAAASAVGALLRGCPNLRVLATSREPLRIGGESVYRLPLLAVPPAEPVPTAREALTYDAVALFAERARAADAGFALTDDDAPVVAEICRRVDGIALGIELAASRVGTLALRTLAARLGERLAVLTGGDRSALPRQQTMRALLDWSHDLLAPDEAMLFRRVAIFAGGFDLAAASSVSGEDVLEPLAALVRKSLVVEELAGGEGRYRLLDSTREYARAKLAAAGESATIARRHAEYLLRLAREAAACVRTAPPREWVATYRLDLDNFRAALEWALGERADVTLGAQLAAALVPFFDDISPSESARWVRRGLDALGDDADPAIEAPLRVGIANNLRAAPATQLRVWAERAVALYRALGDRAGLCEALRLIAQLIGWYFRAERAHADALALESIALARTLGDPVLLALCLRTRGLTIDIADFPAKRAVLEESLALARTHANARVVAGILTWLSELEFSAGERERALALGRDALQAAEEAGSTNTTVNAASNLALYCAAAGDTDATRRSAGYALALARDVRAEDTLTWSVQAFACVAADAGDDGTAARLLGFCEGRAGVVHPPRQADQSEDLLFRELETALRGRLGEERYARALAAGRALGEPEALALALAV